MIKKFEITDKTILSTYPGKHQEQVSVDINQFIDLLDKHWEHTVENYLYWEFYIDHKESTITFSCIVSRWIIFENCEKKLKYKLNSPNEIIVCKDIDSNMIYENIENEED